MRTVLGLALLVLLATVVSGDALATDRKSEVEGRIAREGLSLDLTDTFVVFYRGEETSTVYVYFLPARVPEEKVEQFGDMWAMDAWLKELPSPDEARWKDWCPYGELRLKLASSKTGAASIRTVTYLAHNFTIKYANDGFGADSDGDFLRECRGLFKRFEFKWDAAKEIGTLDLQMVGEIRKGQRYAFDVKVSCDVISASD